MFICDIKRTNTILYCRYWEATVRFYRDVLELTIHHQTEWLVEFHLTCESFLSIANAAATSIQSASGSGITLSWRVDDVIKAHGRLIDRGVKTSEIRPIWGARAFYFLDPEGHRIELWS